MGRTSAIVSFDGKYQTIQKTSQIAALDFKLSEILAFNFFYLDNFGKGCGVQHSQ